MNANSSEDLECVRPTCVQMTCEGRFVGLFSIIHLLGPLSNKSFELISVIWYKPRFTVCYYKVGRIMGCRANGLGPVHMPKDQVNNHITIY